MEDLQRVDKVVNGYFYIMEYMPKNYKKGYDIYPLIYCTQPSQFDMNCFRGINLHHLPFRSRMELILKMDREMHFSSDNTRHIMLEDDMLRLFPPVKLAIREYNKKNVHGIYLIRNSSVAGFLRGNGEKLMMEMDNDDLEYFRKESGTRTAEV